MPRTSYRPLAALLATYGPRYVDLHGNAHRATALRARLDKLTGP